MQKTTTFFLLFLSISFSSTCLAQNKLINVELAKVLQSIPQMPKSTDDAYALSNIVNAKDDFNPENAFKTHFQYFKKKLDSLGLLFNAKTNDNEHTVLAKAADIEKSKGLDINKIDIEKLENMSDEDAAKYLMNNTRITKPSTSEVKIGSIELQAPYILNQFGKPLNALNNDYFIPLTDPEGSFISGFENEKIKLAEQEDKELKSVPLIKGGEYGDMPDLVKTKNIKKKFDALQNEVTNRQLKSSLVKFKEYLEKLMQISKEADQFILTHSNSLNDLLVLNNFTELQKLFLETFRNKVLVAAQATCFYALTKKKL